MALPDYTMRSLLEAGAHFGHQSHRWNPKMAPFIFGARNNIHIIDLAQTVPLMHRALQAISDTVAGGGRVLFVGTKRQAADPIADAAKRSAQYYINSRWLGGMLTNWKTISASIQRLRKVDETLDGGAVGLTKKERLMMSREREKLEKALGGIKDMGGVPDLIFVIDTNKEQLAIKEANRLGIPVAAIVDTNCNPDGITYPIPGNDDASRAILLYCDLVARAAIDGISRSQGSLGIDVGEIEQPIEEEALEAAPTRAGRSRGAGRSVRAAVRPARRSGRHVEAERRQPAARPEAQRRRHLPLLAARRHVARGRGPDRPRPEARRPPRPRGLGHPGPRARRRRLSSAVDAIRAGASFAAGRRRRERAGRDEPEPAGSTGNDRFVRRTFAQAKLRCHEAVVSMDALIADRHPTHR